MRTDPRNNKMHTQTVKNIHKKVEVPKVNSEIWELLSHDANTAGLESAEV